MLALLLNTPRTDEEWARWSFAHRDSHTRIRQAIQSTKNTMLPDYQLEPIFQQDLQGWLQRNSQMHQDFSGVLGVESFDLLDVDFKDEKSIQAWAYLHYQAHYNAEAALGI